jgi:NAD(P)-dependent dehydrogenase (short-subunit alcohol dehydrogenase family)
MAEKAFIIGGTSGIGLAAAKRLIADGYDVTVAGRSPERLAAAGRALPTATTVAVDAADNDSVRRAFAALGPFDHLVLAFGSNKGLGPFASAPIEDVAAGFAEKVFPQFAVAQAALPSLRRDGSITFISAVSGQAAMPGSAGIGAANAAVAALVPILAAELKPLRVNGVSPGVIDTPWWDFVPAEQKAGMFATFAAATPVGRIGTAEDVAGAIAFLIANTFMDGHTIICDGGVRLSTPG